MEVWCFREFLGMLQFHRYGLEVKEMLSKSEENSSEKRYVDANKGAQSGDCVLMLKPA
jgi:hypothetical protein